MKRRHFLAALNVFLIDRSGRETVFAHYPKL